MATQSIPQIPPRPARSLGEQPPSVNAGSTLGSEIPKIPPRPHRRIDRSMSPSRESYARSPLNEPNFVAHRPSQHGGDNGYTSVSDKPARPPSVINMPSVGQEGMEYAEIFTPNVEDQSAETRNVTEDLKLHAPKPSLPQSSAKERIGAVTRTDSSQAAALGLGKAKSEDKHSGDDKIAPGRSLKTKQSFTNSISNGSERPVSAMDNEDQPDGPEIGQRVPMYPNAGLVQAPSPAPSTQFAPGIGFHNDGTKPRHHGRRTSARGFEGPPGSYGMHGHGIIPKDKFEQAYYEKHPELRKKETGTYGEDRRDWALSSEDLNKIVRETASRGSGLGTSPAVMGTPTEQVGYVASEEYISRMSSPRPASLAVQHSKAPSNASDTPLKSPLRKESLMSIEQNADTIGSGSHSPQQATETAIESEAEDDDVVHVDEPARRISKIYGGAKHADSAENLGPTGGNTSTGGGFIVESGYGVPILASDEVAKAPFGYELQPAVSPQNDNQDDKDHFYHLRSGSASSLHGSQPPSRPGSIHRDIPSFAHQAEFDRDARSTPLEDVEEYEPLFPDDEKSHQQKQKPQTQADKLKSRPELKGRKFPSQDVWEDAPDSHMHTATVSTPQLPEENEENVTSPTGLKGETATKAFARRQEELADQEFRNKDTESFLREGKHPWDKNPSISAESRSGSKQRFPSRDIWEDTPDSLQLQATVSGPQSDEMSVPEERPTTGAVVYHQEKQAAGLALGKEEGRATTGVASVMKPSVPPRPSKKLTDPQPELKAEVPEIDSSSPAEISPTLKSKQAPAIPERSKPIIPARPARKDSKELDESGANAALKTKPPVPSRPVGSKIAALQGGFMSELNKRLQLGPQAPKEEEPKQEEATEEIEKAPLVDARKGRARGPARRAPAKVETKSKETSPAPAKSFSFSVTTTLWEICPDDNDLRLPESDKESSRAVEKEATSEAVERDDENQEAPVKSTAVGSVLLSAKELIQETAANASRTVGVMVGTVTTSSPPLEATEGNDVLADMETEASGETDGLSASVATIKPSRVEHKSSDEAQFEAPVGAALESTTTAAGASDEEQEKDETAQSA